MSMMNKLLKANFPPVKYAFISNYIVRTKRFKFKKVEKPLIDTIFVCENKADWNRENFKVNKSHYPLISKLLSVELVNFFSRRGAKIHFNQYKTEGGELIRYGIVDWKDFKLDLTKWKYLTISTYMHKPVEVLVDSQEVIPIQKTNLMSAVAVGALLNWAENGEEYAIVSENSFYEKIMEIPVVKDSYFKIFDDKVIKFDVRDLIDEFRDIYLPIIEEFKTDQSFENFINFNHDNSTFLIKNSTVSKDFFLNKLCISISKEAYNMSRCNISFNS
jgi:hypothetical protein